MFQRKNNALENANAILDQGKSLALVARNEAVKNSNYYAKRFRKAYPHLVDDVKNYTQATLKSTGKNINHLAHEALPYARKAEKQLLFAGFLYAVYKLFIADDERVYKATTKAKARIKAKPMQATLLALGAGLLLGKLW